ncbi:MAG: hypothetical protein NZ533_05055 [Casimicrobiaceae bacterium]|nr:hypothetical protein [Casimicrobiaceae bacterium]MCX8099465.1 hypothetical protein [Casimicrobiaceae bacterium]MDW8312506.1 hypothetical protein [Burkholderiales bacterium]
MQRDYPAAFERLITISEAEWCRALSEALGLPHERLSPDSIVVTVATADGSERIVLRWRRVEDLKLGSMRLPRLRVAFDLTALAPEARSEWMQRFDRDLQRGGG